MNRREALKRSFVVLGGAAVSTSLLSGLLVSCESEPALSFTPQFFEDAEVRSLSRVLDILLPTTDTPGALDAGVMEFLDGFATSYLPEENQTELRDGIAALTTDSQSRFDKDFLDLTDEQQIELIKAYDQAAFGKIDEENTFAAKDFYPQFKETACWAFCTSERGAKEHLQFVFDPGGYSNCVPIEEVGGKLFLYP